MSVKTEAEQKVEALEFIAPIIEAQMRFDQSITNRLMSDAWEAAERWATRFRDLIEAVDQENDSIRVLRVLDRHYQPDMDRQIDHYRSMRGAEGGEAL